ncbi:LysR substrate-binding domain-containing protein [Marinomonas posidonica]|uniref:Transcriptional regulator, LysR family n=1 Tax=Marinomonas posidonica (strain CECT 7376 / NCIMB 14433 / IVIA-Po-181) TaxID=491952 RepID=F6CXS3_MARPP|nr:LysR substrate-binding domain-containing protein [Marinomonas posidonica]AEF53386.1 transcriptional regulator, LysR family [Marinomonas posidonica IVIA-Po-181]
MSLPYTSLHTFHLVVRFGSLKQTADHLSLTESAVSHQIKRLESQLGYALFYKNGRQLKATPRGLALAEQLAQPFDHIDHTLLNETPNHQQRLTLYCLPSLLEPWLLPLILTFKEAHPELDLIIRYHSSAPEYLDENSLRISSFLPNHSSQYKIVSLFTGQTIPVCSPLYLNHSNPIDSPTSLLKVNLLHDHSEHSWQTWFSQFDLTLSSDRKLIYEDFHLLKMATLAGQGVALCPSALIQDELAAGRLIALFPQEGNKDRYYGLEYSSYAQPNLQQLIHYLQQNTNHQS